MLSLLHSVQLIKINWVEWITADSVLFFVPIDCLARTKSSQHPYLNSSRSFIRRRISIDSHWNRCLHDCGNKNEWTATTFRNRKILWSCHNNINWRSCGRIRLISSTVAMPDLSYSCDLALCITECKVEKGMSMWQFCSRFNRVTFSRFLTVGNEKLR